jgi:hypothetical protein
VCGSTHYAIACPAVNPYQIVPPSEVANTKKSSSPFPVEIVGAVADAQSTELGHVTVLAVESCIKCRIKEKPVPLAGGLENVNVVFSVSVCLK